MYKQLSIAVTLCALAGGFSTAQAQVMCGEVITTSEVLTTDLFCGSFDPAVTIEGPGRLNMRRFTVSCEGSGAIGILLTGSGALLQNGTVTACGDGVALEGNNHRVENQMLLEGNSDSGLDINSGSGHRVSATTARNNGDEGFDVIDGVGGNFFSRNRATGNSSDGFDTDTDVGDTYIRNVASGNGDNGFEFNSGNFVSQNVAQNNDGDGFDVEGSNNRLTRNNARNNLDDGIDVKLDALNNTLTENNALGNGSADLDGDGGFDLEDDNVDCDNNTWTQNRGIRNQLCIQ